MKNIIIDHKHLVASSNPKQTLISLTPSFHPETFRGSLPSVVILTKAGELAPPSSEGPTPVSLTPCVSNVRQPLRGPSTVSTVSRGETSLFIFLPPSFFLFPTAPCASYRGKIPHSNGK
jgi:hypothetical protein